MTEDQQMTVFITGASAGIGEATARTFAQTKARLILAARRIDRLEKLAGDLSTDCHLLQLDVRDRRAVESAVAGLPEDFRAIDVLVNNAGLSRDLEKLHEGNPEAWDEMIDTNVKGLLYVSRAVLPGMVERRKGHIINVGSISGHQLYPGGNVYCATKFAVNAITQGLLIDLIDTPVRVSTVDPGMVETEFSDVRFRGDAERAQAVYKGLRALDAADVAEAILWVAQRPPHVQVAELIILPTDQGATTVVHRRQQ